MAASATIPFVSVEQYLHSDTQPDVDYVDGVLEERNLGEQDHSDLQGTIHALFYNQRKTWQIRSNVELRVQVTPTRYRIPDICVVPANQPRTPILRVPPLLCCEVKSPRFTLKRERTRAEDYIRMGVPEVWIFDPETRTAYVLTANSFTEHREGTLKLAGTPIELDIAALFAVLDE